MDETEVSGLLEIIKQTQEAFKGQGALAGFAAILFSLIKLYQSKFIQSLPFLPQSWKWATLKPWAKMLVVFGFAFAGSILTAFASGASWVSALTFAIVGGLSAMGINSGGDALTKPQEKIFIDPDKQSLKVPIRMPGEDTKP